MGDLDGSDGIADYHLTETENGTDDAGDPFDERVTESDSEFAFGAGPIDTVRGICRSGRTTTFPDPGPRFVFSGLIAFLHIPIWVPEEAIILDLDGAEEVLGDYAASFDPCTGLTATVTLTATVSASRTYYDSDDDIDIAETYEGTSIMTLTLTFA